MARTQHRLITAIFLALLVIAWPQQAHAEPISAAITSALISAGLTATIGSTTVASIIAATITTLLGVALTSAVSFGITALSGKPKTGTAGTGGWADRAAAQQTVSKSSIETRKIVIGEVTKSGSLAMLRTSGKGNLQLNMILVLADHLCESIDEVYLDERPINPTFNGTFTINGVDYYQNGNTRFNASGRDGYSANAKLVIMSKRLGEADQVAEPILLDSRYAFPNSLYRLNEVGWTESDRLRGICNMYLGLAFSEDVFKNGTPNVRVEMKGAADMYDPRDGSYGYSNNWALAVRYYLKYIGFEDEDINDDSVIASANISDENVTLKDGGTQKRYTINGVIDTAQQIPEVLEQLAICGAGAIVWSQGQWHIFAGAYDTPSADITADWLAEDEVQVVPRPSRDELFNCVKGVYTDGTGDEATWQPTDFPPVVDDTYIEQDGGVQIFNDIELPFVTDAERAQRIARQILERHRQGITVKCRLNYRGLTIRPWDNVTLTLDDFGWNQKVFRVLEWEFTPGEGVDVLLREESPQVYDWDESTAKEITDLAPDSQFNIDDIPPPGSITATEELYNSTQGTGIKTRLNVSWQDSDDLNAIFINDYLVSYKLTSESEYETIVTSGTTVAINDLSPGTYNLQVVSRNKNGATSEPVTRTVEVYGLTAKPSTLTGLALTPIANQAHIRWNQSGDFDVLIGGSIRVRYSPLTSGAQWETATQIAEDLAGVSTNAVVPLLDGTYLLKAVDSTGNEAETAATITSNVVNFIAMNAVKTVDQDPTFPGTKDRMVVDSDTGWLKLDSEEDWDDLHPGENIDDWPGLIDSGFATGVASEGTYLFYDSDESTDYIDLGEIYSCRITMSADALITSNAVAWDDLYPGTNIDSWPGLIDGDEISQTIAHYEIRHTDDDPSGSPTWSDWEDFVVGDYEHRAYQLRVRVENGLSSNNIFIKTLTAVFDIPDRLERFEDQVVPLSGGKAIAYGKPYYNKPEFGITLQGAEEGDTVKYTHTTSGGLYTGVTVEILNTASHTSTRTVDLYVKGY